MSYEEKNADLISKWSQEHLCPCRIAGIYAGFALQSGIFRMGESYYMFCCVCTLFIEKINKER